MNLHQIAPHRSDLLWIGPDHPCTNCGQVNHTRAHHACAARYLGVPSGHDVWYCTCECAEDVPTLHYFVELPNTRHTTICNYCVDNKHPSP